MCLIQIKHAQIKFHLFGFWTVHQPSKKVVPFAKYRVRKFVIILLTYIRLQIDDIDIYYSTSIPFMYTTKMRGCVSALSFSTAAKNSDKK